LAFLIFINQLVNLHSSQRNHRQQLVELLEAELERHPDNPPRRSGLSSCWPPGGSNATCALPSQSRFESIVLPFGRRPKYDGKWVIETNDDTISLEDAACGYKGLMVIERCFRSLKRTQIKMTPMYHWLSRRIEVPREDLRAGAFDRKDCRTSLRHAVASDPPRHWNRCR
jgi:hypothetical protein